MIENLNINKENDLNNKNNDRKFNSSNNNKSLYTNQTKLNNAESDNKISQKIFQSKDSIYKKNIFIISDEISDNDKLFELLSKSMMHDNSLINDKTFSNDFNDEIDNIITQIYIAFSTDAKNLFLEK